MKFGDDPTHLCPIGQDLFTPWFTVRRDRIDDTHARKEESNFLERLFLFAIVIIAMVGGWGGGDELGCR